MPSAIEITLSEYRNPPAAVEIEPSKAGFSESNYNQTLEYLLEFCFLCGNQSSSSSALKLGREVTKRKMMPTQRDMQP